MNNTLEYIDDYFTGALPAAERTVFENRISEDEAFAQEVAFYLTTRRTLRSDLISQKQKDWVQKETKVVEPPVVKMKQATNWKRILSVAASVVLIVSVSILFLLNKKDNLQQLAGQYVEQNFTQLSASMGITDSLQMGIEVYNRKDYEAAKKLFSSIYVAHPDQTDALKYNGLVSLRQKDYDKAISHFKMLSGHTELYANPGIFYQAIALIQRNNEGDKAVAKQLLEKVVTTKQEGIEEAVEWLKEF